MNVEVVHAIPISIDWFAYAGADLACRIGITMAPGRRRSAKHACWDRDLGKDLDRLREQGMTCLVSLLGDEELRRLGIPDLVHEARRRGVEVLRFPLPVGGVPADVEAAVALVEKICDRYADRGKVVIHCGAGKGRSGMIGACVRLAIGMDPHPEAAIYRIREARNQGSVEKGAQEGFVARFFRAWHARERKRYPGWVRWYSFADALGELEAAEHWRHDLRFCYERGTIEFLTYGVGGTGWKPEWQPADHEPEVCLRAWPRDGWCAWDGTIREMAEDD